jgi:winged helix DNA-binding protein
MKIGRARLANQQVTRPRFTDPADVVRWHGAVQAQDYLGGLWGVGLRTQGATESSVEDAVRRRAIVRTWPMRGTLHFVAASDVRWMTKLLTPRVIQGARSRYRQLELDDRVFAKSARVVERSLAGGKVVRRDRLYEIWSAAGIRTHDSRGLHLLGFHAMTGLLCFGPREGKQQTFTLLEEWLPAARTLERDEALGELARRYFTSHGPATVHDFAWWAGLTIAEARAGLDGAKSQLVGEEIGGRSFWFADAEPIRGSDSRAHLLPPWDEFTVAYRDRSDILDAKFARRVNNGGGVLSPVMVVGGHVIGTWKRTLGKGSGVITPTFFQRVGPKERRALEAAAHRYGQFLGVKAQLADASR